MAGCAKLMRGLPGFLLRKGKTNGEHGAGPIPRYPAQWMAGCAKLVRGLLDFLLKRERPMANMGQSPIPHYWERGSLIASAENNFDGRGME